MCITIYWDNSHQAKLANWGTPGIWVSFAEGQSVDASHVYNPKTMKISLTKDVTFLHKSYRKWCKVENSVMVGQMMMTKSKQFQKIIKIMIIIIMYLATPEVMMKPKKTF